MSQASEIRHNFAIEIIKIESENEQNPYIWFSMGIAIPIYTVLPYCVIMCSENKF